MERVHVESVHDSVLAHLNTLSLEFAHQALALPQLVRQHDSHQQHNLGRFRQTLDEVQILACLHCLDHFL